MIYFLSSKDIIGSFVRFSPNHEELTVPAAQGCLNVWNIAEALKQST
jgi:death-on-curing protein